MTRKVWLEETTKDTNTTTSSQTQLQILLTQLRKQLRKKYEELFDPPIPKNRKMGFQLQLGEVTLCHFVTKS